jgi:hypothetical protein
MSNLSLPSERSLRAADRLVLVDPNVPIYYLPLYTRFVPRKGSTLEIPVDSQNPAAIQSWRDRITQLNLGD